MGKYRVVFHLDEGGKARADLVLRNIDNLIADLGEKNVEVEIVANSEGILALLKTPNQHKEQIRQLGVKGVRFLACANAMREMGVTKDELLDLVEIVPAGVGELVKKQAEGWGYIRP